jgi:hypothetical protein
VAPSSGKNSSKMGKCSVFTRTCPKQAKSKQVVRTGGATHVSGAVGNCNLQTCGGVPDTSISEQNFIRFEELQRPYQSLQLTLIPTVTLS